jgi:hypothetical protein
MHRSDIDVLMSKFPIIEKGLVQIILHNVENANMLNKVV